MSSAQTHLAKGDTLLNFGGIRSDLLSFTVDLNTRKQGRCLPGSRIPIHAPQRVRAERPNYLLLLPWNLKDEIVSQMSCLRDWDGRFVVPIPQLHILSADGAVIDDAFASRP